jgi:hypothetical protein
VVKQQAAPAVAAASCMVLMSYNSDLRVSYQRAAAVAPQRPRWCSRCHAVLLLESAKPCCCHAPLPFAAHTTQQFRDFAAASVVLPIASCSKLHCCCCYPADTLLLLLLLLPC